LFNKEEIRTFCIAPRRNLFTCTLAQIVHLSAPAWDATHGEQTTKMQRAAALWLFLSL
jgi:hypothetical protein